MATTVNFRDPQGRTEFTGISGTTYTVSTTGVFTISQGDVVSAINAGMTALTATTTGIVAAAAGGQANGTALNPGWNQVSTANNASATPSVQLPASYPGLSTILLNDSANTIQVFANAATADTVNGVAGSTGIPQAPNTITEYRCAVAKYFRVIPGQAWDAGLPAVASPVAVTANGTTQAQATALAASYNLVSVPAANDGVVLPLVTPGARVVVQNISANILKAYPGVNDNILGSAANIAISLAANTGSVFIGAAASPSYWTQTG